MKGRFGRPTIKGSMKHHTAIRWLEALAVGVLVSLLGLLFPGDQGFAGLGYLPQALTAVVVASLLGAGPGVLALVSAALATAALPLLAAILGFRFPPASSLSLLELARIPAAVSLVGALAAGSIRDAAEKREKKLFERIRETVRRSERLSNMTDTLIKINEELEARVSGQRESVSTLYARIRKMDKLELGSVLEALLEGVRAFSQAERAAVYEYDPLSGRLALQTWIEAKPEEALDLADCIEGWAFRNDRSFSLRMVGSELGLAHIDTKRSILTYPLKAGEQAWGILNIDEMPFYRYNPTTEKNLEIIVSLAAAYIRRSVDFRERVLKRPRNLVTGLPGYGELVRLLGEELANRDLVRGSLSAVLVEFLDFDKLVFEHSGVKALGIIKTIAVESAKSERAIAFHYKSESQLAFILPGRDRDGASLFCLEFAQLVDTRAPQIDGVAIRLEPVFGLAAAGQAADTQTLLAEAERLLALSRGAFVERAEGMGGAAS